MEFSGNITHECMMKMLRRATGAPHLGGGGEGGCGLGGKGGGGDGGGGLRSTRRKVGRSGRVAPRNIV